MGRILAAPGRAPKRRDVDMTQGGIVGHIIRFSLPLLAGNLFQQLYNTVDTWVVGNYVSTDAMSAVGMVAPIINMLIGAFMGLASGAGVVISQYYGAGDEKNVRKAVHTCILMTLILGVVFTVVGLTMTPLMLNLMNLHAGASAQAEIYLTIYFSGVMGLMLYNMGAGILRAVGDSQRPFYYLVVCAVLNTGLDLLFVLGFGMGTDGVALATVISQCVSAILVLLYLLRADSWIQLSLLELRLARRLHMRKLFVGIPSALQMALTAFSNVFVQRYIASFDAGLPESVYAAGWTAYSKVDQLLFLPMQSISLAVTTFVGQNLGKCQPERAKKGVTRALLIAMASTAILMVPVMLFAPYIVGFLNNQPAVIENGTLFLRTLTPFYLLCCFNQIYSSALRGAGNSRASMLIMLSSFVLFRQVYLAIMSNVWNEILPIAMSYPAGWLLCSLLTGIYYHCTRLDKTRLVEETK